jgi:mycothiol system anti-sigma-R factor
MDCREVGKVVFLYIDDEMEESLVLSFRRHIDLCPGCARRIVVTRRLLELVRKRCVRASAPDRLRRRILTSFPHRRGQL